MCGNFNCEVQSRTAKCIGKPAAARRSAVRRRPVTQDKNVDLCNGDREEKENMGAVITPQAALSYAEMAEQ